MQRICTDCLDSHAREDSDHPCAVCTLTAQLEEVRADRASESRWAADYLKRAEKAESELAAARESLTDSERSADYWASYYKQSVADRCRRRVENGQLRQALRVARTTLEKVLGEKAWQYAPAALDTIDQIMEESK